VSQSQEHVQLLLRDWLVQQEHYAQSCQCFAHGWVAVSRQNYERNVLLHLVYRLDYFKTVQLRHLEIEQNQKEIVFLENLNPLFSVQTIPYVKLVCILEVHNLLNVHQVARAIVNNENVLRAALTGKLVQLFQMELVVVFE